MPITFLEYVDGAASNSSRVVAPALVTLKLIDAPFSSRIQLHYAIFRSVRRLPHVMSAVPKCHQKRLPRKLRKDEKILRLNADVDRLTAVSR